MLDRRKKQKIGSILLGAFFALLALGMLYSLVRRHFFPGESEAAASPAPTTAVYTAGPSGSTISVAGKQVSPDTDSFDLSGRTLTGQDMAEIASLSSLETLSLTNCGIYDLSFLATLHNLRTLYLPDNRINDLTPLTGLSQLKTLYLDDNPLTDLTPLALLPNLSMLSIQGVEIADYVLADLQQSMPGCRIFSDSVVEAARPITLGGTAFTEDVEVLDLSWRGITDISRLSYCLQLRDLNLSGNPLESLNTLSGLPKLTVLNLSATGLTDEDLLYLATLQRLTYLDVSANDALTAQGIDGLAALLPGCSVVHDEVFYAIELGGVRLTSDMTEVDLSGRALDSVAGLETFRVLRRLTLVGNGLEDISPLAGCTALEELDLRYNRVRDLTPLYNCTALRTLDLGGNGAIDPDQIRALQEALPGCAIITDVDLSMSEPTPVPPGFAGATPEPEAIPVYPDTVPVG